MIADGTSPREPQPQDFGLSAERAALLDHPYERVTDSLFQSRTFWTIYLLALAFALYMLTGSVALTVMLGLLLGVMGAWLVPLLAGAILLLPLGAVWKRLQSDYPSFARFQAAKVQYARDLAEWVRTQEQWWRSLTGTAFEIEVGRVFQRSGYVVERTGRAGDQGVDLLLRKKVLKPRRRQAASGVEALLRANIRANTDPRIEQDGLGQDSAKSVKDQTGQDGSEPLEEAKYFKAE